ncbi:MAG: hypothetical protein LBU32_06180 [Clostridiales bacterium]|jgi:hypothetical protein|nr:hypothetical protein [Clostridiales bacterium]
MAGLISANSIAGEDWREGMTADFRLRIFGFLPLGVLSVWMQSLGRRYLAIQALSEIKWRRLEA